MSKLNEIQTHISGVKSTRKVTRAMYLTSASKSQRAKAQLAATLPYFRQILSTMSEILASSGTLDTPYFVDKTPPDSKKLYLVIGGDKGMAGGYTHNLTTFMRENIDKDNSTLLVAGTHGRSRVKRDGYDVDFDFSYPVMNPGLNRSREIAERLVEKYRSGDFREVYLIYTEMVTPLKQTPVMIRLLPLSYESFTAKEIIPAASPESGVIEYEPGACEVFEHLVPHYLKGIVYGAFVEAFASEQNSRMFAMDNATKSADEMVDNLTLQYNHERQARITQELTEVISGIPAE